MFSKRKGFTLVEIMIVVAIIALLAAIAIPNLLRSRLNAAEANAKATLKTLSTAYESYAAAEGDYNETTANLADNTVYNPPYLNDNYADGNLHQGYVFSCTPSAAGYTCTATPTGGPYASTGKSFSICTGGILKESSSATTTAPTCP